MNSNLAVEIDHGIIIDGTAGIFAGSGIPTEAVPVGSIFLSSKGMFQYGALGWEQIPVTLRNIAGQLKFNNKQFSHWSITL